MSVSAPMARTAPAARHTTETARHRARVRNRLITTGLKTLLAAFVAMVFFFPILWWILAAFKTTPAILTAPPGIVNFDATLRSIRVVLFNWNPNTSGIRQEGVGAGTFYSIPYLVDSAIIGIGSTLFVLLLSTPAAYALSRFRIRRKKDLTFWILSQRMLPVAAIAFPLNVMFRELGLIDTYRGLILVHTAINAPLAVLLMLSFMDEVPRDLDDAAMVDGASRFRAFTGIVYHYLRGGLMATGVLCFVFSFSEFLLTLVLTQGGIRTVPVASSTFTSSFQNEYGFMAALGTASTLPIFLFILLVQRHLVRGLTLGAVK